MQVKEILLSRLGRGSSTEKIAVEDAMELPRDSRRPARIGLWVILAGFGGFLLWAALAPLDEGVSTQGSVVIDTKRKAVQHLQGGLVKEVFVREGQYVHEGDPLMKLDDGSMRVNYEMSRQQYLTLRAMEGRLISEQADSDSLTIHPDLMDAKTDAMVAKLLTNQTLLLQTRRRALRSDLEAVSESIAGMEGSLKGLEGQVQSRNNQIDSIKKQIVGIRELVKEGYAPRNTLLELERSEDDRTAALADLQGNIIRIRQSILEQKMRVIQRKQEYQKEVASNLSDVRREVEADAEKVAALRRDLERSLLKAPVSGQVVGLSVQTVGGVIQPSQKVMDIVPDDERLLLEAKIAPQLIDSLRVGQPVVTRFSAFAHSPQLVVEGKLDSISSDLMMDAQVMDPTLAGGYYLARIVITEEGRRALGKRQLMPGMQAEVLVRTGERSLLTYLMHPLLKRVMTSMKEE